MYCCDAYPIWHGLLMLKFHRIIYHTCSIFLTTGRYHTIAGLCKREICTSFSKSSIGYFLFDKHVVKYFGHAHCLMFDSHWPCCCCPFPFWALLRRVVFTWCCLPELTNRFDGIIALSRVLESKLNSTKGQSVFLLSKSPNTMYVPFNLQFNGYRCSFLWNWPPLLI